MFLSHHVFVQPFEWWNPECCPSGVVWCVGLALLSLCHKYLRLKQTSIHQLIHWHVFDLKDNFGQSCKALDLEVQVKQRSQTSDASRGASHLRRDGLGCLAKSWANPGFQRYEEFFVSGIEELWATGFFDSVALFVMLFICQPVIGW